MTIPRHLPNVLAYAQNCSTLSIRPSGDFTTWTILHNYDTQHPLATGLSLDEALAELRGRCEANLVQPGSGVGPQVVERYNQLLDTMEMLNSGGYIDRGKVVTTPKEKFAGLEFKI